MAVPKKAAVKAVASLIQEEEGAEDRAARIWDGEPNRLFHHPSPPPSPENPIGSHPPSSLSLDFTNAIFCDWRRDGDTESGD